MAGRIFGTAGVGNAAPPAIAGFKVQTAVYGLPIPIVYGQARVAGNLIHFTDQKATAQLSQGSRSKLVKIDQQVTGYLYQAAVAIALSEGPIIGIAKVWRDKDASVAWSVYSAQGWSLFLGTAAQAAWSYLTSNHPSEAVPYQLTAYVAHPLLELPNDVLSNFTFEVQGLAQFGSFGIVDANPGAILTDALTNADHGAGFPSAQLGDLSAFTQYCTAAGLFLSPVLSGQAPLADQLAALVDAANSACVWSDGKLKVLPYADQAITGNGQTYTPNVTPLYDLTDNDFLAPEGTDPVTIVRKRPSECFNQLTVEYEDRAHDYNPNVQEFKDQASIDANGLRPAPALRFPAVKDAATARYVAQLKGQRELSVLNSYQFTLPVRYALLEPMDLVTLTDAGLGLNLTPVRIVEVVESEDGALQMTAEDFPAGIASASRYGAPAANGTAAANNVAPGATTAPTILEGPGALASSALEIWLAASGGANWGGCDVHLSTDNVTYQKVGSITRKANYGVLSVALASAAASPPNDTTHTLAVDLTSSGGALAAGSASDLAALLTLCLVDTEFLAYQGATLTAANKYNLTTLARGLFGSPIPGSHAIGAPFLRCDGALLKLPFPQGTNGQIVYFKFPAFNVFGLALEDVATVTAYAHTIALNSVTTSAPTLPVAILSVDAADSDETTTSVTVGVTSGTTPTSGLTYTLTSKLGSAAPVTLLSGAATALPLTINVTRDLRRATVLKLSIVDPLSVAPVVRSLTVSASGRDGARGAGAGHGRGGEDNARAGAGGLATPRGRIPTDPVYDRTGATPLIDTDLARITTALAYPSGVGIDALKPAEAGANITETRTSNDTSNVGARAAATVRDDARYRGPRNAGHATGRDTEDLARGGTGGMATPGGRTHTEPLMDATNSTGLIDTATKTMLPGLAIGAGVRGASDVAFGTTVQYAPNRHNEAKSAKSGDSPIWDADFENIPEVRVLPQVYTAPAASSKVEFKATGVSVSGFTARAVSSTGATTSAKTNNFAPTLNGTTAASVALQFNNDAAYCNLSNANTTLTTYEVVFDVDTTGLPSTSTLTVRVYRNAGSSGGAETTWTQVGSRNFGSGQNLSGQVISFDAALGVNYDVRVVLTYTGGGFTNGSSTVDAVRVDYDQVTPGTETALTAFADAAILYQAVEKS